MEKKNRLNLLPDHPETRGRFPSYLHRKLPKGGTLWQTRDNLSQQRLVTVCEEAKCPNLPECYSKKTATFLAMGKECTRNCGFCAIDFAKTPKPLAEDEPLRLAESVKTLGLKHVVITMVARDDLSDGGAHHLADIIAKVRSINPSVTIEVLTSDFEGNTKAFDTILAAAPEIFNHNVETVRELTPRVRHKATYERSLALLRYVKEKKSNALFIKSGIMLGLGETKSQVHETLEDLRANGCDIVTIGHYLQPSMHKLRVKDFISPDQFEEFAAFGRAIGIAHVYAGPFVRSSYNASDIYDIIKNLQRG